MQRALEASGPTTLPEVKPQPSLNKVVTASASEQKDVPTLTQKEKSTAAKTDITQAIPPNKETPKAELPLPALTKTTDVLQQGSIQEIQIPSGTELAQDMAGENQSVGKTPQVQISQTTKPDVKAALAKQAAGKPLQQPSRSATPPAKAAPSPPQPAKQETGGFFGFGGPKPQPAAKSAESVTGKMFGFGSSIFSSASTLITSAVQDEPKTTPPTPRKMSATPNATPKATPPVSPKMAPAKETKPPGQKSALHEQTMPAVSAQDKEKEAPPVLLKLAVSTCPLCKAQLNIGSKDPPNYNMCTQCKNTVCSLCGFNPMPHTATVSMTNTHLIFIFL